ncbi:MAG: hypothetical protein NWE89_17685 [Candidatus Bathyarchaeota archaeon]|nr:hypothetical protein [Candidatus Bathyarchaeota archaeon]
MAKETAEDKKLRLKIVGLHYCTLYENVVRYNAPACHKCPHCTYPR